MGVDGEGWLCFLFTEIFGRSLVQMLSKFIVEQSYAAFQNSHATKLTTNGAIHGGASTFRKQQPTTTLMQVTGISPAFLEPRRRLF